MLSGAPASVIDFGADPTGATDSTTAVQAAINASDSVYFPSGSYLVGDVSAKSNTTISGNFKFKYTGANSNGVFNTFQKHGSDRASSKVIYVHHSHSLFNLAQMVNVGFDTIIHYGYFQDSGTMLNVIQSCQTLGLKLIINSQTNTPTLTYDSNPQVIGYYLFDEPTGNGFLKEAQDARIAIYRPLTNKLLYMADYADFGFSTTAWSSNFDVVFFNPYLNPGISEEDNIHVAIYAKEQLQILTKARLIPAVGLFNNATFSGSTTDTVAFANRVARLCPNSDLAFFIWEGASITSESFTASVISTPAYYAAAQQMITTEAKEKININTSLIARSINVTNVNDAVRIQNIPASSPNIIPFVVKDVGVFVDNWNSDFAFWGIGTTLTGGTFATNIVLDGFIDIALNWTNKLSLTGATISIVELNGSYKSAETVLHTEVIAGTTGSLQYRALNTTRNTLGIKVIPAVSENTNWKFLTGRILAANWS